MFVEGNKYRTIATYIPCAGGHSKEEVEETYDQINIAIGRDSWQLLIIGGDFNTQLGVGPRAAILHDFAAQHELRITSGMFRKPFAKQWTFQSSGG
eukprot:5946490-Heterocapsa_arctica.AAC.1